MSYRTRSDAPSFLGSNGTVRRTVLAIATLFAISAGGATNDAAWRADLEFFASELPRRHVSPFTRVSRQEFELQIASLSNDIPLLADHEVIVGLLRIVASLGDSHTTIYPSSFARFPITLHWFRDGIYVTRATPAHRDLVGSRLLAIGDRQVEEVVASLSEVIPHENDAWLRHLAPEALATPEVLHALRVIPTHDTASFRFLRLDGTTIQRELERLSAEPVEWVDAFADGPKPLYLRDLASNYWYDYSPATQTLYVQYNRCRSMPDKPIAQFGSELGAVARQNGVARLILDLRHNGGGDSSLLAPLLTDVYTSVPDLDDPGRFFVVIGQATFSSAVLNAFEIDARTSATLIGAPTGGKPNHFGNVATFTLPRSRIVVQYPTQRFTLYTDSDPPSLLPHVLIDPLAAEYFAGSDPVLESIIPRPRRRRAVHTSTSSITRPKVDLTACPVSRPARDSQCTSGGRSAAPTALAKGPG